jgi:hypothetical protein
MQFLSWQNYFMLTGGASATLAGLLYVALTYSVGMLGSDASQTIRIWAEPSLNDFKLVLLSSLLAQVSGLPGSVFGAILLISGIWRFWRLAEVVRHLRGLPKPNDLEFGDWLELAYLPALFFSLCLASGLGLCLNWYWAQTGVAALCLGLLMLGINNTWSQLVWMTVEKHKGTVKSGKKGK